MKRSSDDWDPNRWKTIERGPCIVYPDDNITVDAEPRGYGVDLHIKGAGMPLMTVHVLPGVIWIGMPMTEQDKRDNCFPLIIGVRVPSLRNELTRESLSH